MVVSGYCTPCRQYLCDDCHVTHNKLQMTRGHTFLTRDDMPHQKEVNKRQKLDFCRKHPRPIKDMQCSTHNKILCTLCCSTEHQNCVVNCLHDISTVKVKEFYDVIKGFKMDLESVNKTTVKVLAN